MKLRRIQARDDRGAAAIEFALVMVPLLLLIGGIVDFGWMFAQKIALAQSVREGTRVAVVQPAGTPTPTVTLVRNAAGDSFIGDPNNITVVETGSCADAGIGNNVTVEATYVSHPPMGLVNALIPGDVMGDVTMTSQATFRCEW